MAINVGSYHTKLSDLQSVLSTMGNEPSQMSDWLFSEASAQTLSKLRAESGQSMALIKNMPKFQEASVLGYKWTDARQLQVRQRISEHNQQKLYEEIDELDEIQRMIGKLRSDVSLRLSTAYHVQDIFADRAREGGQSAAQDAERASHISSTVMPVLIGLKHELALVRAYLLRERKLRQDRIDRIDKSQLSIPKYNRRARRKRKARAAAKAKAAQKTQEVTQDDEEPT